MYSHSAYRISRWNVYAVTIPSSSALRLYHGFVTVLEQACAVAAALVLLSHEQRMNLVYSATTRRLPMLAGVLWRDV
jgi:hypothetical protein